MDVALERWTLAVEDEHWWYRGRRRVLARGARRARAAAARADPGRRLRLGAQHGRAGGPLRRGRRAGARRGVGGGCARPRRGRGSSRAAWRRSCRSRRAAFDLVVSLDVLEHVGDDAEAFAQIGSASPCPAAGCWSPWPQYGWLWGEHDVLSHHHRRYTRRSRWGAPRRARGGRPSASRAFNTVLLGPDRRGARGRPRARRRRAACALGPGAHPARARSACWGRSSAPRRGSSARAARCRSACRSSRCWPRGEERHGRPRRGVRSLGTMTSKTWFISGTSRGFGREWTTARPCSPPSAGARAVRAAGRGRQQRRLRPVRDGRGAERGGGPRPDRDQRVRRAVGHPGRAAVPARAAQRPHHPGVVDRRHLGVPGIGMYHASKWALEGFSQALAQEVAGFGIKVTLIEPGGYSTDWGGARPSTPTRSAPTTRSHEAAAAAAAARASPGDPTATARGASCGRRRRGAAAAGFFGAAPLAHRQGRLRVAAGDLARVAAGRRARAGQATTADVQLGCGAMRRRLQRSRPAAAVLLVAIASLTLAGNASARPTDAAASTGAACGPSTRPRSRRRGSSGRSPPGRPAGSPRRAGRPRRRRPAGDRRAVLLDVRLRREGARCWARARRARAGSTRRRGRRPRGRRRAGDRRRRQRRAPWRRTTSAAAGCSSRPGGRRRRAAAASARRCAGWRRPTSTATAGSRSWRRRPTPRPPARRSSCSTRGRVPAAGAPRLAALQPLGRQRPTFNGVGNHGYGAYGENVGIGNIDDDPQLEIIVTFDNHQINAFNHDGTSVLASPWFTNRQSPTHAGRRLGWGQFIRWAEPARRAAPLPPPRRRRGRTCARRRGCSGPPRRRRSPTSTATAATRSSASPTSRRSIPYRTQGYAFMVLDGAYGDGRRSARRHAGFENAADVRASRPYRPDGDWYPPSGIPAPTVVDIVGRPPARDRRRRSPAARSTRSARTASGSGATTTRRGARRRSPPRWSPPT